MDTFNLFTTVAISMLLVIIIVLVVVYLYLSQKSKVKDDDDDNMIGGKDLAKGKEQEKGINRQSIYKFMDFEKVEDNMIIQKDRI